MSSNKLSKGLKTTRSIRNLKDDYLIMKLTGSHRSMSKNVGSSFAEAFERFRSMRPTLKLTDDSVDRRNAFKTTTIFQYLREDLGGVSCVRFSPETEGVAVGFYCGDLQVCRPNIMDQQAAGQVVQKVGEGGYALSCLKFHPKHPDFLYASSLTGTVSRRDISDDFAVGMDIVVREVDNEINSIDFDLDGDILITGGKDASLRMYDVTTRQLLLEYGRQPGNRMSQVTVDSTFSNEERHEKRIYCVKFHPEEKRIFVSGGWDECVKIWDTRVSGGCVRNIIGPYIFGEAIDVSEGRLLTASCIASESLELWDIGSGKLLTKVIPTNKRAYLYGEYPYAAQFFKGDPSGNMILCGGTGLGGLQVINLSSNSIIYLFEDSKPVVAVDSKDMNISFGGKSNALTFCRVVASGDATDEEKEPRESTPDSKSTGTSDIASASVKFSESTETFKFI